MHYMCTPLSLLYIFTSCFCLIVIQLKFRLSRYLDLLWPGIMYGRFVATDL